MWATLPLTRLTDLELQRQDREIREAREASKADTGNARMLDDELYIREALHEKIQWLLDSDHLWLESMNIWLLMVKPYAAEARNSLLFRLPTATGTLDGVKVGMSSLVSITQRLLGYETKLLNQYPELYETPFPGSRSRVPAQLVELPNISTPVAPTLRSTRGFRARLKQMWHRK